MPCTNVLNARCPAYYTGNLVPPAAQLRQQNAPASGVGIEGAGVRIVPGGLSAGAGFTIPTSAFRQAAGHQFTPILSGPYFPQLDTSQTFVGPAAARAENAQSGTRKFRANAWSQAGNGQSGRVAAATTPISRLTQAEHNATVRYTPGLNAFGGTMALLQSGSKRVYYSDAVVRSSLGMASTRPWVGTVSVSSGDSSGNPFTRAGAGWGYTRMRNPAPQPFVIRNNAGIAPDCTQLTPPAPPGCGLITHIGDTVVNSIIQSDIVSTRWLYAFTTGTVSVSVYNAVGAWSPASRLTAMGFDTTSMTSGGGTVRNIGLVAGAFARRDTADTFPRYSPEIVGLNIRFSPEPGASVVLPGALALLGLFARRRSLAKQQS